jgi:hypothetical protein
VAQLTQLLPLGLAQLLKLASVWTLSKMVLALSRLLGMAQPLALQVEEPLEPLTQSVSSMTLYLLSVLVLTLTES